MAANVGHSLIFLLSASGHVEPLDTTRRTAVEKHCLRLSARVLCIQLKHWHQ